MSDNSTIENLGALNCDSRNSMRGPTVVLIEPQLGENIGTTARAMFNFGLDDLRLVRPRKGWKNDRAFAAASGADALLSQVQIFDRTQEAISDLHKVYATTGRPRDMTQDLILPADAGRAMRVSDISGELSGVLFGPERSGLTNNDLTFADAVISIPANPNFKSLNLAMAVLLIAYEWFSGIDADFDHTTVAGNRSATKAELQGFFDHLEGALDDCGFLRVQEKRPHMIRNIRNIFQRAHLSEQEVRTLRGVISGLVNHPSDGS